MKPRTINLLLVFAALASFAYPVVSREVLARYAEYIEISPDGNGTHVRRAESLEASVTTAQSKAIAVHTSATLYRVVGISWKTYTDDPGTAKATITGTTVTVSWPNATTGTFDISLLELQP